MKYPNFLTFIQLQKTEVSIFAQIIMILINRQPTPCEAGLPCNILRLFLLRVQGFYKNM